MFPGGNAARHCCAVYSVPINRLTSEGTPYGALPMKYPHSVQNCQVQLLQLACSNPTSPLTSLPKQSSCAIPSGHNEATFWVM